MTDPDREARLTRLVERFYELGREDALLAPIFAAAITDWPDHIRIVADFWSHAIYGTERYRGSPFPVHMRLDFPPEAFERWLAAFEAAATETLTPMEAEVALGRARHMTQSFRVGLFPYTLPDGTPSRRPPSCT
ncbi:MAG: group III truncated hemoglobin [Bacteroidota bacterium]